MTANCAMRCLYPDNVGGYTLQDTNQPLPQEIIEALMQKKRAFSGLLTKRQLLFGRYHSNFLYALL